MRLLQNKCCNGIVILSEDKFVAKLELSVYTFTTLTLWVVFSIVSIVEKILNTVIFIYAIVK